MMRWLVRAIVVVGAVLLVLGAVTILPPLSSRAGAYLADRNLGLAALLLVLLVLGWNRSLAAVLLASAAIHLVDAAADLRFGNLPAAIGSLVVSALTVLAGVWLLREKDPAFPAAEEPIARP